MTDEQVGRSSASRLALASVGCAFAVSLFFALVLTPWAAQPDVSGGGVLVLLSIPVGVGALAFGLARLRHGHVALIGAASALSIFSFLGAATIGLLYLPSALAMSFAAARRMEVPGGSSP